ncbi:MAG TPA: hypothetical protein VM076_25170 [Gemmatimonadaceae bacterium]|nr:hypothetical protein [Gemmatimonadaceae bacterium]
MRHDPPDSDDEGDDEDDEFDTYAASGLMAGGVTIGPDGVARPMPEHQALAAAIPQWVLLPEHEADALAACLGFASHDHPVVRGAAVAAFGNLAVRYGRLENRERVVQAIELALRDREADVRDAAFRSATLLRQTLGWQFSA